MSKIQNLDKNTACLIARYEYVSVWDCVIALVKNSIQSEATNIAIRVDLTNKNIRIQVIDDGQGMSFDDMNIVGKQAWTSNENNRGQSLANIRRVSELIVLSSRNKNGETFTVCFDKGRRNNVERDAQNRKSCGTTITVSGFLWNLRVRRKMVREAPTLACIKRGLLCLAFLHPSVKFSLRNDTNKIRELLLNTHRGVTAAEVFQKTFADKLNLKNTMQEIVWNDLEDGKVNISGFISCESFHNCSLQFICVNGSPLQNFDCLKIINNAVRKHLMSTSSAETVTNHPIFVLFINSPYNENLKKMLDSCFNKSPRNRAKSSSFNSISAASECIDDGIFPLGSTCALTDSVKNEAFKHSIFTPCKSSGRISRPIYTEVTRKSENVELNINCVHEGWSNPNFKFDCRDIVKFPMANTQLSEKNVKLTKYEIENATVLGQVDKKYLVSSCISSSFLLLWDQHAVHERINLEFLLKDWNCAHQITTPFRVTLPSAEDVAVLISVSHQISKYGVNFTQTKDQSTVIVTQVPRALKDQIGEIQIDVCAKIFLEIISLVELGSYPLIPKAVHHLLATRACRGSIMFGHELSKNTCSQMLRKAIKIDVVKPFIFSNLNV